MRTRTRTRAVLDAYGVTVACIVATLALLPCMTLWGAWAGLSAAWEHVRDGQ